LENAPFCVVTPGGLVSAPIDHFDHLLLERATTQWHRAMLVVAETMIYKPEPYRQVGDLMLLMRVIALAEGDPRDMHSSRVRLPS
jgi:Protein of unknown function